MLTIEQRLKLLEIAAKIAATSPGLDIVEYATQMERYVLSRNAPPPAYVPHSGGNPIPYPVATSISLTEKTNGKS